MALIDGLKNRTMRNIDWLSSVWRITTVNPTLEKFKLDVDLTHPAPFPEELAYRLVSLYSRIGDYVLDPFCGSGTTNFVALGLDRRTIGYDIERIYVDAARKRCRNGGSFFCKSSENMSEVDTNSIQLCVTSPPYLTVRCYSDNRDNIGNKVSPYPPLRRVFEEIYRVLEPGGVFSLNVGEAVEKGYLVTFPFDMIYVCKDIGFRFRSSVIWDKGILIKEWNIMNNEIAQNHEYIWIFKK